LLTDFLILCDGFKKLIFRKIGMNLEVRYHYSNGSYEVPLNEKEKTELLNFLEENGLKKKESEHLQRYRNSLTGYTFDYEGFPLSVLSADAGVEMQYFDRKVVESLLKNFAEKIGKKFVLIEGMWGGR
jgi:hypothetical protein